MNPAPAQRNALATHKERVDRVTRTVPSDREVAMKRLYSAQPVTRKTHRPQGRA